MLRFFFFHFDFRNMFDFKHIQPFERSYADQPGPMVVFATPGMLHAGNKKKKILIYIFLLFSIF
jgi:Cft2 family RNA processing exonuclease